MKRKIIILFGIFLVLILGIYLMLISEPERIQTKEQKTVLEAQTQQQNVSLKEQKNTLEQRIREFAEIIYTYDTRNRKFYEGADVYMTQDAYKALVPFLEEIEEDETAPIFVVSTLKDIEIYYKFFNESHVKALMEASFILGESENGRVTQYMKISAEKEMGEWNITDCLIVDTIEE